MPEIPALQTGNLDVSNALFRMGEIKRQREQDTALAETRGLQNEVIRGQIDRQPMENKLLATQIQQEELKKKKALAEDMRTATAYVQNLPKTQQMNAYNQMRTAYQTEGVPLPDSSIYIDESGEWNPDKFKTLSTESLQNMEALMNPAKEGSTYKAKTTNPKYDPKQPKSMVNAPMFEVSYVYQGGKPVEVGRVALEDPFAKLELQKRKDETDAQYKSRMAGAAERNAQTNAERKDIYAKKTSKDIAKADKGDIVLKEARAYETARYNKSDVSGLTEKQFQGGFKPSSSTHKKQFEEDVYATALKNRNESVDELRRKYPNWSYQKIYETMYGD